ncbi:hypothetical protein [Azospirillum argentinense]
MARFVAAGKRLVQSIELFAVAFGGLRVQIHDRIAVGLQDGGQFLVGLGLLSFQVAQLTRQRGGGAAFGDGIHNVVNLPGELGDAGCHGIALCQSLRPQASAFLPVGLYIDGEQLGRQQLRPNAIQHALL